MAEKSKRGSAPSVSATDILFARKKPNLEQLLSFGFEQQGSGYIYTTGIVDGQFRLTVSLSDVGAVSTVLTEAVSGEEYVLHRVPGPAALLSARSGRNMRLFFKLFLRNALNLTYLRAIPQSRLSNM